MIPKTALSVGEAIDLARAPSRSSDRLVKDARSRRVSDVVVTPDPTNPTAVMKAVHAAGGVHLVRKGATAERERFSAALATVIRKNGASASFLAAADSAAKRLGRLTW